MRTRQARAHALGNHTTGFSHDFICLSRLPCDYFDVHLLSQNLHSVVYQQTGHTPVYANLERLQGIERPLVGTMGKVYIERLEGGGEEQVWGVEGDCREA